MTAQAHSARRARGKLAGVVAFDIETLDRAPAPNAVTAAAVYDPSGASKYFLFRTSVGDDPSADSSADAAAREEFLGILDRAPSLCSFNGIQFDMRFMRVAWGLPDEQVEKWVLKTFDVFEASRLALGRYFALSRVLELNGLEAKTGSGADAIRLAREHRWEELGEYCLQDTRVTHLLCTVGEIALPLHLPKQRRVFADPGDPGLFKVY